MYAHGAAKTRGVLGRSFGVRLLTILSQVLGVKLKPGMPEPNGNSASRLDRIEAAIDLLINDHLAFRDEHRSLLRAQVLLTGTVEGLTARLDALTTTVDALTTTVDALTAKVDQFVEVSTDWKAESDRRMTRVEQNLDEATDKINSLVDLMDRHLKEKHPNSD